MDGSAITSIAPYIQTPVSFHPVRPPQIHGYVNFDFGVPSAGFASLIGFLGMEIQITHGYSGIQNTLFSCFP
jgi:hypothetical protein